MSLQHKLIKMCISAACALCRKDGHDPHKEENGSPLWNSYLGQVDKVISGSIRPGSLERLSWVKK